MTSSPQTTQHSIASETHVAKIPGRRPLAWADFIPWFMTAVSVLVLICLAWFLLENIFWFRTNATASAAPKDEAYRIYIYHLHVGLIKRSVGLFAGFALIFIGTSVVFYTLDAGAAGVSAKFKTTSYGIVAMVLGVSLIVFTIQAKDEFPPAPGGQTLEVHPPGKTP